jgi:ribose transport system ATP-binding protein
MPVAVELTDVVKAYGGVHALNGVSLRVRAGEVHALVGANGAGKSTLIKCIGGATDPDSGEIFIGGQSFSGLSPRQARDAGVAIIYQDFSLAESLPASENIFLGSELRAGPFVRRRAQENAAREILTGLGAGEFPFDETVDALSAGERQLVEIAKAVRRAPKVLVLDEPTASLTEREAERLANHVRRLKAAGLAVIYITHRIQEVFELADTLTVLRGGKVALSGDVADFEWEDVANEIVASERSHQVAPSTPNARRGRVDAVALEARGILAPGVGPLDLAVRRGEVLGVYGLLGSGRTELLESLFGSVHMSRGELLLHGERVTLKSPSQAIERGIALVPADRLEKSLFPSLTSRENVLMPEFARLSAGLVRRRGREAESFEAVAERTSLHPRRADMEAHWFSGGNQQKLAIGRWLQDHQDISVLMLDEPTQGVDIGARSELYQNLTRAAHADGLAVIVTSSEPSELFALADRIVVLSRGQIAGELDRQAFSHDAVVALAHLGETGN